MTAGLKAPTPRPTASSKPQTVRVGGPDSQATAEVGTTTTPTPEKKVPDRSATALADQMAKDNAEGNVDRAIQDAASAEVPQQSGVGTGTVDAKGEDPAEILEGLPQDVKEDITRRAQEQQGISASSDREKIFENPSEDPDIAAIEANITTRVSLDSQVQRQVHSSVSSGANIRYSQEWQDAFVRIGNEEWDSFVARHPEKAQAYAEKHPQMKAALERKAQAEEAAATGQTNEAEQPQATAEETTDEASTEAASQDRETNATDNELRVARRLVVLTKSKSEALKYFRKLARMEAANAGQTLTPEQEIQQARDQFVGEQTEIAMGRLGQGDTTEQIVAGGESLFQEQQRKVRSTMEAEGRTQDEAFEGEVTKRSLHAYFQERDRITTEMMQGDNYKNERYTAEQIKQGVSRVVEQAKLAGKTEITDKEALEQAQREFANLRAESLQARPDGIAADVQENPYFQKAMREVHTRRKDLAERNGIEMNAAWYADVQKEALTEAYVEELKEKKTLLELLLEAFKQATISFGIVGVNILKGEFEETATGK